MKGVVVVAMSNVGGCLGYTFKKSQPPGWEETKNPAHNLAIIRGNLFSLKIFDPGFIYLIWSQRDCMIAKVVMKETEEWLAGRKLYWWSMGK